MRFDQTMTVEMEMLAENLCDCIDPGGELVNNVMKAEFHSRMTLAASAL